MGEGDPAETVNHIYTTIPNNNNNNNNASLYSVPNPANANPNTTTATYANIPSNPNNNNPSNININTNTNTQPNTTQPSNVSVNVNAPPNYVVAPNTPGFIPQPGYVQYVQAPNGPQVVYQVQGGFPQGATPQIIYVQAPNVMYSQPVVFGRGIESGPYQNMAVTSFILFILSVCVIYLCELPSIIITLVMVHKKIITRKNRNAVLACSIIELIGWVFLPCIIWYSNVQCYTNHYYGGFEDTDCVDFWWGWIGIVVWYVFQLAFGIPRVVYTFAARNNQPEKI